MKRLVLLAAFIALLVLPLLLRTSDSAAPVTKNLSRTVIIMTPSNEQIRFEFGRAFSAWHQKQFGQSADVQWSMPGGAVEIRMALIASWESRLRQGLSVGGDADLIFGGGSYEFDTLKREVSVSVDGRTNSATILEPVELPAALVQECYGVSEIAGQNLYDLKGYWYGVALSTFGIVMNEDVLKRQHIAALTTWSDLANPQLFGWVSMVNPAQSGSVLTAFEAITQRMGWLEGLAILRRSAANARGFAASSPRVSIDVAAGDAAAGVTIDLNARFQIQALNDAAKQSLRATTTPNILFIAPAGQSAVDPDPVGMLRNPPHRETAIRFMQFCLSKDAQRLWQLHAGAPGGPEQFELRRMPVMRALYTEEFSQFIDQVDPLDIATPAKVKNSNMRAFLPLLFQCMAMETHKQAQAAWKCIFHHPAYPKDNYGLVLAQDVSDAQLKSWLEKFDALPSIATPDGARSLSDINQLQSLRNGWLRGEWKAQSLWPAQNAPSDTLRALFVPFFQENYQWIIDQAAQSNKA